MFHWEAEIAMGKMKERDLGRQRERERNQRPIPLFIYTTKDSRLRFLAPKHTSRLLFLSEVPHSTKRLGDRAEASWGQRTSVHPPSLYMTFHFGHLCQRSACVHKCVAGHVLMCTKNVYVTARYVCLYN